MLTLTSRYDNIMTSKGGDNMIQKIIKFIKKVLATRKVRQAQNYKQAHINEQLKLIHEGLEQRGY